MFTEQRLIAIERDQEHTETANYLKLNSLFTGVDLIVHINILCSSVR